LDGFCHCRDPSLSGDLYTISVPSSDRWRCVVISALTFLVEVPVNAITGVWKKLRNSDNCWYYCLAFI
jgi:hypothetical protein